MALKRSTSKSPLAQNVCRLRAVAVLSQEKLAEKAGIDARYLQKIEAGAVNPSIRIAAALRKALGCSWDELLAGL